MVRLGSMLASIVGVASLAVACSDGDSGGICFGNSAPRIYLVPIVGGGAGAGGAESGIAGAGGAGLDCSAYCAPGDSCALIESAGELSAQCTERSRSEPGPCPPPGVSVGRRPEGLLAPRLDAARGTALGVFFANVAHLEAASIHAFARLGHELRRLGAGPELVKRARRAARDEVRHAARLSSWAKRYGASVPRPRLSELRPRSLFDLARENEVEGCVRETFGALVASWQAEHAATAELRSLFASIARDEIAHSELAWQLRAWLRSRLDERERAELDEVQRGAFATLRGELAAEPSAVWCQIAGLPDAAGSARLLSLLVEQLPRLHCLD